MTVRCYLYFSGVRKVGAGPLLLLEGMRIRLTRNLDKPGGFVNGAIGTIRHVFSSFCYVVQMADGRNLLLHPIVENGSIFLPCTYGYAMTIRRAQGATLQIVVLYFDLKSKNRNHHVEEGYAYVGASRVRFATDLYHFGRYRLTDWLPVISSDNYGSLHTVKSDESMPSDEEDEDMRHFYGEVEGDVSSDAASEGDQDYELDEDSADEHDYDWEENGVMSTLMVAAEELVL